MTGTCKESTFFFYFIYSFIFIKLFFLAVVNPSGAKLSLQPPKGILCILYDSSELADKLVSVSNQISVMNFTDHYFATCKWHALFFASLVLLGCRSCTG